ncbi:unnamed protein product, partial [Staurois parvus]
MSLFVIFKFPTILSPYVPTLTGEGTQMTDGGHYREHCRRDMAGAQDKVREEQIRRAAPHGKPECSSGLTLALHSGIPPGRLR